MNCLNCGHAKWHHYKYIYSCAKCSCKSFKRESFKPWKREKK